MSYTGYIYRLYSKTDGVENEDYYIGSTTGTIYRRLSDHVSKSKYDSTRFLYHHMYTIGPRNFDIEILDTFNYDHSSQLREREEYFIRKLKPTLNQKRAYLLEDDLKYHCLECNCTINIRSKNKHLSSRKHNELIITCIHS